VALLRSEHGDGVGYKVGLTSAPMQAFCGIDHPIAGVVLAGRVHRSGATMRRSDFGTSASNSKSRSGSNRDVPVTDTPCTAEMLAPHIDGVCAASNSSTIEARIYAKLDVLRWWRTIPERRHCPVPNLRRNGPIWSASLGVPRKRVSRSRRARA